MCRHAICHFMENNMSFNAVFNVHGYKGIEKKTMPQYHHILTIYYSLTVLVTNNN